MISDSLRCRPWVALVAALCVCSGALVACDEGSDVPELPTVHGTIQGTVTIDGAAAPGITVTLSSGKHVTTDANGAYKFEKVPEGAYTVSISGYPDNVSFASTAKAAVISSDGQVVTLDFDGAYLACQKPRDACVQKADCGSGKRCSKACACECSKAELADCESDADCAGGTCDLSSCTCTASSVCDNPPQAVRDLALALGAKLATAVCPDFVVKTIKHSVPSVGSKNVANDHTTVLAAWLMSAATQSAAFTLSGVACGPGANGLTLCPQPEQAVVGGAFVVAIVAYKGTIPTADPTNHYQYGLPVDADGDTSNNYTPAASVANDFFSDTDRWFAGEYAPSSGWSFKVTDAAGGATKMIQSAARMIIHGNAIAFAIPASELAVGSPSLRVTAFRYTGDYGISPPHDWDGSIWPAVLDGLFHWP